MGTLFDQKPRKNWDVDSSDIEFYLEQSLEIAKKLDVNLDQVLKTREVIQRERYNNLYVANGVTFDEQMAGFGKLFQELNQNLLDIYSLLDDKR